MIEVNYLLVLGLVVTATVLGMIWYGPIFGNAWCRLNGVDPNDPVAKKAMQEGMMVPMLIQIVMTALFVWVLYHYIIGAIDDMSALSNGLWIWLGFIVPTLASSVIWTTESGKNQRTRFLIQAGYNLVLLVTFSYLIGMFG